MCEELVKTLDALPCQAHLQLAGQAKKGAALRSYALHLDSIGRRSDLHRLVLTAPSGDMCVLP